MMNDDDVARLSELFRALADPTRLRILGALAEGDLSGRELSERLRLSPPTISHHMAKLQAAELVSVTPEAQRRIYSLNQSMLHQLARDVAPTVSGENAIRPGVAAAAAGDMHNDDEHSERDKVLCDFFDGPRLKQIPAQRKKRVVVLQHLLTRFQPHRDYPEKAVNALLAEAHEDVATLRRELVDYNYMTRARGIYRVTTAIPAREPTVRQEIDVDEHAWLERLIASATGRALHS